MTTKTAYLPTCILTSRGFQAQNLVFGDGEKFSIEFVVMPIIVGGRKIMLKSEVINGNLPVLISKTTLQNMGAIINIRASTLFAFGCTILLH